MDREAVYHLLWIWLQYGGGDRKGDRVTLPHRFMSAGEDAADYIERLGLGEDEGYEVVLNAAGVELLDSEGFNP